MKKVLAICNLHDCPHLGQLTANRQVGTTSFLGRYGLMDFTMSNFSNSNFNHIAVLCEKSYQSVHTHLGGRHLWINNTKTGSFAFLTNEKGILKPKFNTDVANLNKNYRYIADFDCDYFVIAPTFFLTRVDFNPLVEAHEKSGADITLLYTHSKNARKQYLNCDEIKLYAKSKLIKSTKRNAGEEKEADISLETFVFSKAALLSLMNQVDKISSLYGLRDMVNYYIQSKELKVAAYEHKEHVLPILSLGDYVDATFSLLKISERNKLFSENWPIYTTTHNTPPALYGKDSEIKNSFVANGAIIKGSVENCIVGRNVIIETGATLKNCILFSRTVVGEGCNLENVLCDKDVVVANVKKLKGGKSDEVLYIPLGAKI
jgi:glucose-1-phosphate adenylyltransferase